MRAIVFPGPSIIASVRCAVLHAVSRRAQSKLDSRALGKKIIHIWSTYGFAKNSVGDPPNVFDIPKRKVRSVNNQLVVLNRILNQ